MTPTTTYQPGPDSARAFRDALGCYGTGVTVVTALCDRGLLGMTANSFSSVSLDPALVLWSPAKSSKRHDAFASASRFVIHVLGAEQRDLALHFATTGDGFDQFDYSTNADGIPVFSGCLSHFECENHAVHDAGDHSLILGRVLQFAHRSGDALMFRQGRYGQFSHD